MFYDLAGREFNKKPMGKGTLIEVHKGFFDTLDDNELYKDRLGIIVNVERFMEDDNRGSYNLMPMYDIIYLDLDGNIIGKEMRIRYTNVRKASVNLTLAKYAKLNEKIKYLMNKFMERNKQ